MTEVEIVARELHEIIKEHGTNIEKNLMELLDRLVKDHGLNAQIVIVMKQACDTYRNVKYEDLSKESKNKLDKWALRILNKYADYSR